MNLLNILLKTMLTDTAITALAKKTGLSSAQLKKLLPLAIPLLLRFLTKNASTENGALSLLGALTQHTNTKAMPEQFSEADEVDGGKIVNHILGNESANAILSLSEETGMSNEDVNRALSGLAPALLSSLSAATNTASAGSKIDLSDGLDLSEMLTMFGGMSAPQSNAGSGLGLLGSLLGAAPAAPAAPAGAGSLLGALLGGATSEADSSINGTALLSSLLSAMK